MTPSQRGRIGGLMLHATHDSREVSLPGRKAASQSLDNRLLEVVDPAGTLPLHEREARLARARSAHFSRLAHKSAATRQRRSRTASRTTERTAA